MQNIQLQYSLLFTLVLVFNLNAQIITGNKPDIEVKNASFNSIYSDFGAFQYSDNMLVFTSAKNVKTRKQRKWKNNEEPFLNIYSIVGSEESFFDDKIFNKKDKFKYHVSSVTFNKNRTLMYFTANDLLSKRSVVKKEKSRLKIYFATLINNEWQNIKEVPFNSELYSTGHPYLAPNEKELYFVSDRPGGFGLTDIYKVNILANNSFSEVINLGSEINTAKKEMFPFVDEDDFLYFSSNGNKPGLDDLDIYYVNLNADSLKVLNAGIPINSRADDFAFFKINGKEAGYFSSDRIGGKGGDDIYSFKGDFKEKTICNKELTFRFRDSKTLKVVEEVSFYSESPTGNISNQENSANGIYKITQDCALEKIKISAFSQKYVPFKKEVLINDNKLNFDFFLEKDIRAEKLVKVVNNKLQIIIGDIYFAYNKFTISPSSEPKIEKLIKVMQEYPEIKIKINSHTDSRGSEAYNLKLSQKRARAIQEYIKAKGISGGRLLYEGIGEKEILNKCVNKVKCSKEEHLMNRRTTFVIIE